MGAAALELPDSDRWQLSYFTSLCRPVPADCPAPSKPPFPAAASLTERGRADHARTADGCVVALVEAAPLRAKPSNGEMRYGNRHLHQLSRDQSGPGRGA